MPATVNSSSVSPLTCNPMESLSREGCFQDQVADDGFCVNFSPNDKITEIKLEPEMSDTDDMEAGELIIHEASEDSNSAGAQESYSVTADSIESRSSAAGISRCGTSTAAFSSPTESFSSTAYINCEIKSTEIVVQEGDTFHVLDGEASIAQSGDDNTAVPEEFVQSAKRRKGVRRKRPTSAAKQRKSGRQCQFNKRYEKYVCEEPTDSKTLVRQVMQTMAENLRAHPLVSVTNSISTSPLGSPTVFNGVNDPLVQPHGLPPSSVETDMFYIPTAQLAEIRQAAMKNKEMRQIPVELKICAPEYHEKLSTSCKVVGDSVFVKPGCWFRLVFKGNFRNIRVRLSVVYSDHAHRIITLTSCPHHWSQHLHSCGKAHLESNGFLCATDMSVCNFASHTNEYYSLSHLAASTDQFTPEHGFCQKITAVCWNSCVHHRIYGSSTSLVVELLQLTDNVVELFKKVEFKVNVCQSPTRDCKLPEWMYSRIKRDAALAAAGHVKPADEGTRTSTTDNYMIQVEASGLKELKRYLEVFTRFNVKYKDIYKREFS